MSHLTINGVDFEVNRLSREKFNPTFVLHISISNHDEVEMPRHERNRILDCGYRRNITNDLLRNELEQFMDKYPDAEISGFGVIEEFPAREADRIRYDNEPGTQ